MPCAGGRRGTRTVLSARSALAPHQAKGHLRPTYGKGRLARDYGRLARADDADASFWSSVRLIRRRGSTEFARVVMKSVIMVGPLVAVIALGCARSSDPSQRSDAESTSAPSASATTFSIVPPKDPDPSLRFASADGSIDRRPMQRPKPWLVEDPNLEALMPDGQAVDLEETWRIDEITVSDELATLVRHEVRAELPGAGARLRQRDALSRLEAMHLGPNVTIPVSKFLDVAGLQQLSIAPRASWSGLPVGISMGASDALFQVQLTAYLPPEREGAIAKFAAQIPEAKIALAVQTELHALLGKVSYGRRCGRTPSSTFELRRRPSPEEKAKIDAVDIEPLGLDARWKKQLAILTAYSDRFRGAAERALRARGFHADGKSEMWTSGTTVAFFGGESMTLVFGGSPAADAPSQK